MDTAPDAAAGPLARRAARLLRPLVDVRPHEAGALLAASALFFCLLAAYYLLRPLRDALGLAGGAANLPWLFTATFAVMLLAVPAYGALASRLAPRRFVPVVYRFFAASFLGYGALFAAGTAPLAAAASFFVWISVFNLFVVSVFWSVLADRFSNAQARRLYGFVAAGGTAGTFAGPALAAATAQSLGPTGLAVAAALLLEAALRCLRHVRTAADADADADSACAAEVAGAGEAVGGAALDAAAGYGRDARPGPPAGAARVRPAAAARRDAGDACLGGSSLAGLALIARTRYLQGIALHLLLLTFAATFLYMEQGRIVAAHFADTASRTRFFALLDLSVSALTLLLQLAVTGRLMQRFGVVPALVALPASAALAFALVALWPGTAAIAVAQTLRRATEYAVARPAREVLWTVAGREAKYKAKGVVDTVVYRGGDAAAGWLAAGVAALGAGFGVVALAALPLAAAWAALGVWLGRRQDVLRAVPTGADAGGDRTAGGTPANGRSRPLRRFPCRRSGSPRRSRSTR